MKKLLKALAYLSWWVWVRVAFAGCLWQAAQYELERESELGEVVETSLETDYLRKRVRHRWGWNPPGPVASFLLKASLKRARELASLQD